MHFSRSEFKCSCNNCNYDTVDFELLNILNTLREFFDKPVKVTSGNRCPAHNASIGGATNSLHIQGRAADIQVKDTSPEEVQAYILNEYPDKLGIGCYASFTHIDTRTGKARW